MIIDVDISPKALRETLCIAQARIGNSGLDKHRQESDIANLQALIDECDRHRPLGPGGKHGDLHTPACGCDDVPATDSAPNPRVASQEDDDAEIGKAVIRSFRRTVPAEDMLKRVRPAGSDVPFGDSGSNVKEGR